MTRAAPARAFSPSRTPPSRGTASPSANRPRPAAPSLSVSLFLCFVFCVSLLSVWSKFDHQISSRSMNFNERGITLIKHGASEQDVVVVPDYHNSRCQSYDIKTDSPADRSKLQTDSGVNFFEKLCLRGMKQSKFDNLCQGERGWAFERVVGGLLEGFNHKEINSIESRGECARLCLLEEEFPCRSAEYNRDNRRCILSRDDRRTQSEAFRFGAG